MKRHTAIQQNLWRADLAGVDPFKRIKNETEQKKVLVINVFFAPQSVGGATRVAQDYVQDIYDQTIDYDVTALCTDYDRWQTDIGKNIRDVAKNQNIGS